VLDTKEELQQRGCFEIFFGSSRAMCESLRIDAVSGLSCAWPSLPSTERQHVAPERDGARLGRRVLRTSGEVRADQPPELRAVPARQPAATTAEGAEGRSKIADDAGVLLVAAATLGGATGLTARARGSTFHFPAVGSSRSPPLEFSEAQSTMRRAQILRPILVNRQLLLGLDRQDE
jgi:hypothetical protein